jgi:hypothetical protein
MKFSKNRLVAFIDILGFKNRVAEESSDQIYKTLDVMHKIRTEMEAYKDESSLFQTVAFSDSLLIYTRDESEKAADYFLFTIGWIVANALANRIPLKGAIAFGNFTADRKKAIYFGKPLIDAYELQDGFHMYGIVLHHTCQSYFTDIAMLDKLIEERSIVEYPAPFKNYGHIKHYLLCWEGKMMSPHCESPDFGLNRFYSMMSGLHRQYIDNTLIYIKSGSEYRIQMQEGMRRRIEKFGKHTNPAQTAANASADFEL